MKSLGLALAIVILGLACVAAEIWAFGLMFTGLGLLLTYSVLRYQTVLYK